MSAPTVSTIQTPAPIPVPASFPISWEYPEDERAFWMVERMHWPDPMTLLDFEFMRDAHAEFNWAFDFYSVPLRYNVRLLNYFWYYAITPTVEDPSEMQMRMPIGLQNLEATIPRLYELWNTEWLPEVKQHLAYWERFDLPHATMPELLAHLDETVARHSRVWQIHFLQTFPVYLAMSMFDDLYRDLVGTDSPLEAYRLLQGFENKTVETGRALWRLSRQALASPKVRQILETRAAAEVIDALEGSPEGQAFLADLRAYLGKYGQRGEKLGVSFASWIEDPTPVIASLQDYVNQPGRDFEAETTELVIGREQMVAQVRSLLTGYPQPVTETFESLLRSAQHATVISEDHNFWIDFKCTYQVRRVLLEFGRRLADAGVLDSAEDVFLLTVRELQETARQLPEVSRQEIVARRKGEMKNFREIVPPPALGTPPSGPPPDDPLARAVGKFFGMPPTDADSPADANIIRVNSGSGGKARGVARVIRSVAEEGKLEPGDVLVATTTAPSWTPLFASAAAVVTDTGGVLSHCAVVAREYQIPAVVGTRTATAVIRDGQLIEVDGDQGIVRIITEV